MRIITFLLLALLSQTTANGQDSEVVSLGKGDYLIYWRCGGMLLPKYHKIFYQTRESLSVDTTHKKCFDPKSVADLSLYPFSDATIREYSKAIDRIPRELLSNHYQRCPVITDCIDCSTINIIAQIDGKMHRWSFSDVDYRCDSLVQRFVSDIFKIAYLKPGQ